jgi:ABC-type methionine transport system permease subunit
MRRALQFIILLLSLLPLTVGCLGLLFGVEFYIPLSAANPNLDSQFRFASGWDVGLAFIVWWIVPQIEKQTALFRIVCAAVFLGGLGRVAAWYFTGAPHTAVMIVTAIELLIPALVPWQAYVARQQSHATLSVPL